MNKNRLGRIVSPDTRDHNHLMAGAIFNRLAIDCAANSDGIAMISALTPVQVKALSSGKRSHSPGAKSIPWDQGETSRCVSFATNRWLISYPIQNRIWGDSGKVDKPDSATFQNDLDAFYASAQTIDGFPLPHDGTTVRAAFQVLQGAGYVKEYTWAFDAASVARHILLYGPVVAGTDWTNPMFDPIDAGKLGTFVQVAPNGGYDVAGGHAYLIYGVNLKGKCPDGSTGWVEFINSWGEGWGNGGRARMSLKDLGILANNQGEFATAQEIHLPIKK